MEISEAVKIQANKSVSLSVADLNYLGVNVGDPVIKKRDSSKEGKKYIAICVPETDDDLALIKDQDAQTAKKQG
jgi:peptide methionine sulfoxide reductase MsrA